MQYHDSGRSYWRLLDPAPQTYSVGGMISGNINGVALSLNGIAAGGFNLPTSVSIVDDIDGAFIVGEEFRDLTSGDLNGDGILDDLNRSTSIDL